MFLIFEMDGPEEFNTLINLRTNPRAAECAAEAVRGFQEGVRNLNAQLREAVAQELRVAQVTDS